MTPVTSKPTQRGSAGTLAALVLAMLTFSVVQTSVVPILPALAERFRVTESTITWMMTANLLAAAVLTPLLGRIGDIRGRKPMLLVAIGGVLAGSALAVGTHSFALLVVARVLQGLGGGVLPLAIAIVRDELPREKVTGGVAMVSASLGVGSGLGLVLTGVLMEHGGYRGVFWMGLGLAAASVLAVVRFVRHDPVKAVGGADPLGALALAGWLSALLIAVSQGNTWGWASARTTGLFATAFVVAALWVLVELHAKHPLVDISMLTKPAVAVTNVAGALVGFAMYGSFLVLSDFTQTPKLAGYGFGATVLHAGVLLVPSAAGSFVAAPVGAAMIRRIGPKLPLALGGLLVAAGLGGLVALHTQEWHIYAASALLGLGVGLAYAAMPAYINSAVPVEQSGIANSVNAVMRTVGGAIGSATLGAVLAGSKIPHTPLPTLTAYQHAFLIAAIGGLVAAVVPLTLRARRTAVAAGTQQIEERIPATV